MIREAKAEAWDEGHRGLCRRHGVQQFEACHNPYRDYARPPSAYHDDTPASS